MTGLDAPPVRYAIDLHSHTCYSDGRPSPVELVEQAAAQGLRTLAITDHDNARATREVRPLAQRLGSQPVTRQMLAALAALAALAGKAASPKGG